MREKIRAIVATNRLRHGHRQAERALRDPLRDAGDSRGYYQEAGAPAATDFTPTCSCFTRFRSLHPRILHQGLLPRERRRRKDLRSAKKTLRRAGLRQREVPKTSPAPSSQRSHAARSRARSRFSSARGGRPPAMENRPVCTCGCSRRQSASSGRSPARQTRARLAARALARSRAASLKPVRSWISMACRRDSGARPIAIPFSNPSRTASSWSWERLGSWSLSGRRNAPITKFAIDWAITRPASQRRALQAPGGSEVRVHQGLSARLRAPLLWRSCGAPAKCAGCDNCLGVSP